MGNNCQGCAGLAGRFVVILIVLILAFPSVSYGEQKTTRETVAVRVVADNRSLADILSVFAAEYHVRFRSSLPLDDVVTGTYSGPIEDVIPRLLRNYDLFIKRDGDAIDVVVIQKRIPGVASAPKNSSGPPPTQDLVQQLIRSVRR